MNCQLIFFGVTVSISSESEKLIERICDIFKKYIVSDITPAVYFKIEILSNAFTQDYYFDMAVITNENIKVEYSFDNEKYFLWEYTDTFLPPLQVEPLKNKFLVLHGCGIEHFGSTAIFLAPSLAGKTTLAMKMLDNGSRCITDDLLFIRSNLVYPYLKPVGIRESSFPIFPHLEAKVKEIINKDTLVFSNASGYRTWLLHLDDIYGADIFSTYPTPIDYIFLPNFNDERSVRIIEKAELYKLILNSACNSGMHHLSVSRNALQIMKSLKGAFYLPTKNLDNAYKHIESILGG